jgi:hypothetical protein
MLKIARKKTFALAVAFANPAVLLYALPWLMFLLVGGTVAQRYIGLYQSQQLFFGSFLFWAGPVPLPGAYTTLGIIALCLGAKLLLKSRWEKRQAGIILAHASVFVLLTGSLITTLYREEGYMVLSNGETSNIVSDYHEHELAILKNNALLFVLPQETLHKDLVITNDTLPFSLHITDYWANCAINPRKKNEAHLQQAAQKLEITPASLSKEEAENKPCMAFVVSGASYFEDGAYIASEVFAQPPLISPDKHDRYEIVMRPRQRILPFDLQLLHFEKSDYPGTDMARSYRSDVTVKDGVLHWNTAIEMNQPLRHHGYTIYQSSFIDMNGKYASVLAVVKNAGVLFPYIAIGMLCAGLLLHLVIVFTPKAQS